MTYVAESWTVTVEETSALRTFERKTVRKIYEEGKRTLENENEHRDKGHITGGSFCRIYDIPPTKNVKTNGDSSD
jgi:hypothetical protein